MRLTKNILIPTLLFLSTLALAGTISVDTGNSRFELEYINKPTGRYVSTDELENIADRRFYSSVKRKESLAIAGESFVFSPDNRFLVVSEATYDLGAPTIVTGDAMLVPLEAFLRVLATRLGKGAHIEGDVAIFNGDPIFKPVDTSSVEKPAEKPEIVEKPTDETVADTFDTYTVAKESMDDVAEIPGKTRWLVVIDPGHGGKDPGASASDATREKDLVLDISKKLYAKLEADTMFDVAMTREDDTFIPLRERTEFANHKNADLFISIHCNAARKKSARGTQVFFLAPASSDHARATAALENASIFLEEPDTTDEFDELEFIMADVIQNEFLREASRLSVLVEEAIAEKTGLPARGPQGAGFYVLKGSYMPGILVETAFLSNPDEALLLKQDNFRDNLAEGIAEGVRQFLEELPDN